VKITNERCPSQACCLPTGRSACRPEAGRPARPCISQLHGPYPTWIRKAGAKTVTRTLSPAQLERYRPLFDNARRLRELTSELETLTAEIVEQAEGWTTP
jgi:hypothetical protein